MFAFRSPQGKYVLTPCPISYAEEQLLQFFGQLLGIAIRADVPLPLDLLGSFWKGLVGEALDPEQDLQEADVLTYNYVKKFENVSILPVPADTVVLIICGLILHNPNFNFSSMTSVLCTCRRVTRRSWRPCVLRSPPNTIRVKAPTPPVGHAALSLMSP